MPHGAENKGPTGGSYANDTNRLAHAGETHASEAHDMAGGFMAYEGVEVAPKRGVERQANESEVRGGNRAPTPGDPTHA